jgi:hypothetical protein
MDAFRVTLALRQAMHTWQRHRDWLLPRLEWTAFGTIVLVGLYQALCHAEAFADDAAISFAYSRQLAETGQLIHTASSERVEGFSNPLWTLLGGLAAHLGMDSFVFARALAVMCLVGTMWFVYRTARLLCPGSRSAQFAATLFAGWAPCVGFWTLPGLETPLVGFLLAAMVHQCLREEREGGDHYSGLFLAALALTRPEGVMYALPVAGYKWLARLRYRRDQRPALWRKHFVNLALMVLPVALYVLWRRWYFGAWVPNTFFAKTALTLQLGPPGAAEVSRGKVYVRGFFEFYHLWPVAWATPLVLWARQRGAETLFVAGLVACHLGFVLWADGDWMGDFRFFAMALPLYACLLPLMAHGATHLTTTIVSWLGQRAWPLLSQHARSVGAAVAAVLALAFVLGSVLPTLTGYRRAGWVSMELVERQGAGLELIARRTGMLRATIAVPDAGGSALYTNVNLLDTVGLVDRVVARYKAWPGRLRQYVFEEARPDFYQAHSHWRKYYNLPQHHEFQRDYVKLPEKITKSLVLLGNNYIRREHLTARAAEIQHPLAVDIGRGVSWRGYDDPLVVGEQAVLRLYVETPAGFSPEQLELAFETAAASEPHPLPPIVLADLPSQLFHEKTLWRLRLPLRASAPTARLRLRHLAEPRTTDWFPLQPLRAGEGDTERYADLAQFLLHPRAHFACHVPPVSWSPNFNGRGRLQLFDTCLPVAHPRYQAALTQELVARAERAEALGLLRTASRLLRRAELLHPESPPLRRRQRHLARAIYSEARQFEATGDLDRARAWAVEALAGDPLLTAARNLYLRLPEQGLQYDPDRRERLDHAIERLEGGNTSPAAQAEMLTAALAADRPWQGLRAWEHQPRVQPTPTVAELAAELHLEGGLCGRATKALLAGGSTSCRAKWLTFRAGRLCGDAAPPPTCTLAELHHANGRQLFDFEAPELPQWQLSPPAGELLPSPEKPRHYRSGYSGQGLLDTAQAPGERDGQLDARSRPFIINDSGLSLQVGGGRSTDGVAVALEVSGREVRQAAGQRDYHARRVTWDVQEFIGQQARLVVRDRGRGEWGFLLLDHVRLHPVHYFDAQRQP